MKTESDLEAIIENFFDDYYYSFSSWATLRGIHRYDYKLSSLTKTDINTLKTTIGNTLNSLKLFEEKNRNHKTQDIKIFRKFLTNLEEFLNSGLTNNIPLIIYDTAIGILSVVLTEAKPVSIKSSNFSERISELKKIPQAITEHTETVSELTENSILETLDRLGLFIDHFSAFFLSKSDVDKRKNLKNKRTEVKETIEYIQKILKGLNKNNFSINVKPYITLNNFENSYLIDLKKTLEKNLNMLSQETVKKAREIRITAPYYETLNETITSLEKVNEKDILEIIEIVENLQTKLFGLKIETQWKINFVPREICNLIDEFNLCIFGAGEFDNKIESAIYVSEEININKFIIDFINYGIIGKGYINQYMQKSKSKRKYIMNPVAVQGFITYIRKLAFEEIKNKFPGQFELYYYYYEYASTLLAYIFNEIFFRNIPTFEIENIINNDRIIIEKEKFKEKLTFDLGNTFLGMQGGYMIAELRNSTKVKLEEFNKKLVESMLGQLSALERKLKS